MLKKLFTPFELKGLHLDNRIVMPGLASFLIEDDGSVTEKTIEHYRKRAAGGPAMVIVEAHAVAPEAIVSPHQARIYDDRFTEGIAKIARVIKSEGAIPALQIHHGGRQVPFRVIKQKPFAPSPLPCPTIRGDVEPLTHEGIQRIIHLFGDSAERVVDAGFELLEIHGAHGYLINSFLSKFSNIREDEYGGDINGRSRFAIEIIQEVRRRVGDAFPLSFKISAQEFVPGGLTTEESIEILKVLLPAGIDIIQVSAGNDATPEWICQPMFMEKACLSDSAKKIKKALEIPVMSVGRINDPLVADDIIVQEKADLVCMGRGLLADPELPKKAKAGNLDDIMICIACNTCMESIFRRGRIECLVNPALGREKEMEIHLTDKPKKVMVVGGGPGGLNVASISAKRGHDVHLYEREGALGGQLNMATVAVYKKEMLNLTNFQKRQIEKTGVKIHLNKEVTLETVMEVHPDAVVLATGSVPVLPSIPGIEKQNILTPIEIFNGRASVKRKCVVVGGGPTGCEVAHHLSENGCAVTIVELLPKLAGELESITRKVLIGKLKRNNVKMMTENRVSRIEGNGVVVIGKEEKESFIEAETIVMAVGNKPVNGLYEQIKSKGITSYQIGDCLEPRSAKAAIYEGAVIGRTI